MRRAWLFMGGFILVFSLLTFLTGRGGVEFYAEMDAYVVISSCPWVNQTKAVGEIEPVPLYISVWETGITPLVPPDWKDWQTPFWDAVAVGEKDISPRTPDSYGN